MTAPHPEDLLVVTFKKLTVVSTGLVFLQDCVWAVELCLSSQSCEAGAVRIREVFIYLIIAFMMNEQTRAETDCKRTGNGCSRMGSTADLGIHLSH